MPTSFTIKRTFYKANSKENRLISPLQSPNQVPTHKTSPTRSQSAAWCHMQYNYHFYSNQTKAAAMSLPTARKSINNYSYHLTNTIGEGFSSQVYTGLDQKTKLPVAIKVVPKLAHRAAELVELAETEIRSLEILKGRGNILELKQALQTKNSIYIVTELCSKGTLRDLLASHRRMPENKAVGFIKQIINGYRSIHDHGLVHRDIKPDNVFLTAQEEVRIGDFGFAIKIEDCEEALKENLGSPLFMSLEALTDNRYGFKSDIWAIGITFYEMLAGRVPWRSKTEKELIREIQNFKIEGILPKGISTGSQQFLRRALVKEVDDRMGPQELFSFDFQQQPGNCSISTHNSCLKKKVSLEVIFESQNQPPRLASEKQSCTSIVKHESIDLKAEKSESTEENNKPNLEKIAEIDSDVQTPKKTGSEKLTNSLTCEQIQANTEKTKTKINRKYSEIKDKAEFDQFAPKAQNLIYRNKSEAPSQVKLSPKMEKEILLQIQSQVNYFRYAFKLFKKIQEILKTNDDHIIKLKQNLLFLVHAKIQQVRTLRYLSLGEDIKELFMQTAEYGKIREVLGQYEERYLREEERTGVRPACAGEKDFIEQLTYTLKVLYQNIVKIEAVEQEFHRKKNLVFIVDDLVQLSNLYIIQRAQDWLTFHQQSNVLKALERTPPGTGLHAHWEGIKQQLKKYINI